MAITNAQQYKQLVNPPMKGNKRPGYRGDDAARAEKARSGSYGSRADPGNAPRGDGPAPRADKSPNYVQYNPDKALAKATKVALEEPKGILNKIPSTIGIARKGINRLMKNQLEKNRIDYIKRNFPQYYDKEVGELVNLPAYLQGLVDEDKLYTDDALKMIQNLGDAEGVESFEDFMFNVKGSPGLKFAGNVGGLGTRSAVRDADGNIIGYKFSNVDEFGNIIGTRGEGEGSNLLPPIVAQAPSITEQEPESEYVNPLSLLTSRIAGTKFAADGGIMNVENLDREAFLLGGIAKGLKKAVRGVKKIAKSKIGKAALIGALGYGLGGGTFFGKMLPGVTRGGQGFGGFGGLSSIFGNVGDIIGGTGLGDKFAKFAGNKIGMGILGASVLPLIFGKKQDDDKFDIDAYYAANRLNLNAPLNRRILGTDFYGGQTAADGGRIGYQEGGDAEPVAKKTMPLLDMDGKEKDYRETGGFVDMGRMERADDVPARLSKNEFVFTADAVRNAGEGDIDKGAEVMYNMMKNLEAGGEVSEESQGLEGARKMFQTSQRLGEVL